MQTIQLEVKDAYVQNVMTMLSSIKDVMIDKIEITKDPMLEMDPYFYERKKHITKTIEDMDSGKMKMYDFEEFENEMDIFEKELELKYAN